MKGLRWLDVEVMVQKVGANDDDLMYSSLIRQYIAIHSKCASLIEVPISSQAMIDSFRPCGSQPPEIENVGAAMRTSIWTR
jgi:hypothetical protein